MKDEKINYYLVLEKRLGDYNIIDLSKLDIANNKKISNNIADIDIFTYSFTEEEIRESIVRSNMARPEYIDGQLKIVSDAKHKHNLTVLTKEVYTKIMDFQSNNEEIDQDFKNKLFGAYKKIIEVSFNDPAFIRKMLERFKTALKTSEKLEIFKLIGELPYQKSRSIYINIYKMLNKDRELLDNRQTKEENRTVNNAYRATSNQNNNKRILEKLNDVS